MSWTAPVTHSTGDFITSAIYNNELTNNMAYLKTYADAMATVSQSDVTASRALDTSNNHIYQNTSGKIRVVAVGVVCNAGSQLQSGIATAYTGSSSPPTVQIGQAGVFLPGAVNSTTILGTVTFIVPNNYYYKVANESSSGTCPLVSWVEWTLF